MKWIPYQRLTIQTLLSKEEVINRMRERVGPKKRRNFVRVDKNIFSGRRINDKFELTLNNDYWNPLTPEITGTFSEKNGKTEVSVLLKTNWFGIGFTLLFIIIGLAMSFAEIINYKNTGEIDWSILAFVLFTYGLNWFGFNWDAAQSIDGLIHITKGKIK